MRKYVDERGLVAYGGWKNNRDGMAALEEYPGQFAATAPEDAAAGLINAYNAHPAVDSAELSDREHLGARRFI